jgi:integrase
VAYYRKLPSGKHNYVVRMPNGKRKSFTDPLKRVAEHQAREFELALRRGEAVHLRDRRVTVAQWHVRWLAARDVEASTARKEAGAWRNHIEPRLGAWPMESVTRLTVQTWVKELTAAGVGPGAVKTAYGLLAVMFADAVDHDLIAGSPCRRITLPRAGRPEPRWLTRHEYDRLQLALATRTIASGGRAWVPDPHAGTYRALVGLGCFSGLRPGELGGLDISHVDLDRQLVRVTQVLARLPDGEHPDGRVKHRFGIRLYPKSDRSVRSVPFPPEVADLLWPLIADRTSGPLFTAPRGGRLLVESDFAARVWRPALEAAGIEPVRPYVMRHTCASWLVQAGVPDRQIMQILGHADTHLIDTYAHLAPDAHDTVRAAWGNARENSRPTADPQQLPETTSTAKSAGQMDGIRR